MFNGSIGFYRTDLRNDIQFVAERERRRQRRFTSRTSAARAAKASKSTPRAEIDRWSLNLRYNHIDATFRSTFVASSPNNSSADSEGAITVRPGNRIPGIPRDSIELRAEYGIDERSGVGVNVIYASSQYALGDDDNRDDHGRLPAYTVVNLDARYQVLAELQLFLQVNNVFDRRYQTLALLGANAFTGPDGTFGPRPWRRSRARTVSRFGRAAWNLGRVAIPLRRTRRTRLTARYTPSDGTSSRIAGIGRDGTLRRSRAPRIPAKPPIPARFCTTGDGSSRPPLRSA